MLTHLPIERNDKRIGQIFSKLKSPQIAPRAFLFLAERRGEAAPSVEPLARRPAFGEFRN
jgi:hypothetical protein